MLFTIWNGDMSCAAGIRFREIFYLPDPFLLPHLKAKRDFTSQYYSCTYLPSWSLASRLSCLETTFFFFCWVISQNWLRACIPQLTQSETNKWNPNPVAGISGQGSCWRWEQAALGRWRGCLCVGGVNKISIQLSCNWNSSSDHTLSVYLLLHHIACTWLL